MEVLHSFCCKLTLSRATKRAVGLLTVHASCRSHARPMLALHMDGTINHSTGFPSVQCRYFGCDYGIQAIQELLRSAGPGGAHEHTLLLVFGDHGQTVTGDHGGGTPEEVDSALFALHMGAYHQVRSEYAFQPFSSPYAACTDSSCHSPCRGFNAAAMSECVPAVARH